MNEERPTHTTGKKHDAHASIWTLVQGFNHTTAIPRRLNPTVLVYGTNSSKVACLIKTVVAGDVFPGFHVQPPLVEVVRKDGMRGSQYGGWFSGATLATPSNYTKFSFSWKA